MLSILKSSSAQKVRRGLFNIDIYFPGLQLNDPADPRGFAQLGRFDKGHLFPGVFVGMHPHRNDEILTYMRSGEMVHEDTEGQKEAVSNTHLMLMNAGSGIYHQESIPENGREVKLLQIFLRPAKENDAPRVQFSDFSDPYSLNRWRLVAGEEKKFPPLIINSTVNVYDTRLQNSTLTLPAFEDKTYLLHVFEGDVSLGELHLAEGDSLIYSHEKLSVQASETADLVLFELDEHAEYTREGMYSGA